MKMNERIEFSVYELIVNDAQPSLKQLTALLETEFTHEGAKDALYSIETGSYDNKYFWMSIHYGFSHPRSPLLIDRAKGNALVENKRTEEQVEPNKQLFCVYVPNNGLFYMSSAKNQLLITEIINTFSGDDKYWIKRILIDPEEFLKTLKLVNKLEVAAKSDLISRAGDLFKPVEDIFGFGAPDRFFISAEYASSPTDAFKRQFRKFLQARDNGALNRFVCVGYDDEGLETVFNAESFTKKVVINVDRAEENGLLDSDRVRNSIALKLTELGII